MPSFDASPSLKPVLKWAGGKRSLLPQLVPLFPVAFERYVEPFVGGGAVFLALQAEVPAHINDANPEIVQLYEVLRDEPLRLMVELDALAARYCEEFFYALRLAVPESRAAAAARTVFLNKTGFNGLYRQNSKGVFNVPFGKRARCPALYERENILAVSRHLARTKVTNVDFEAVLDGCGAGDFVYCDPPYEPLSATSSFNAYKAGGFTREDQRRLRAACARAAARGAEVFVSNSSASFVLDLYAEDEVHRVKARRAINSKACSRGEIDEVLVRVRPAAHFSQASQIANGQRSVLAAGVSS